MNEENAGMDTDFPILSAIEARILASLVEKEATTPDQYPLTQNSIQVACNQKTSRDPLMQLEPGEVGHALRQMENRHLVRSVHGSRAQRYEHRMSHAYGLTEQQQALLAALLLRGPQTLAELHTRTERLAKFIDADALEHAIERMLQKEAPMIVRVPRSGGQREDRYMHLLCGDVDIDALMASTRTSGGGTTGRGDSADNLAMQERIDALETAVAELASRLDRAGIG